MVVLAVAVMQVILLVQFHHLPMAEQELQTQVAEVVVAVILVEPNLAQLVEMVALAWLLLRKPQVTM
tara:strand:+ start:351 stop:551 length:201 start_codon:yes stop_codon:yes gene_type:complete